MTSSRISHKFYEQGTIEKQKIDLNESRLNSEQCYFGQATTKPANLGIRDSGVKIWDLPTKSESKILEKIKV